MNRCLRAIALCLISTIAFPAEPVVTDYPVSGKHTLEYGVEWRLVRAGVARINWSPAANSGYQADLHLESVGLVSKLFRVNDDYQAQLTGGLCLSNVLFKAEEGKRRRETKMSFDKETSKIHYLERDLIKNNVALTKEVQTPACVHEYIGAMHRVRSLRLEPGQSTTIPVTDGKKYADVKVEAQEREQVRTPAGTFSAIRYEVFLFNDVLIPKKARMYLWISDDARRLPVQLRVRMQFFAGTITLQLEKQE